jgi:hypothetical protein
MKCPVGITEEVVEEVIMDEDEDDGITVGDSFTTA